MLAEGITKTFHIPTFEEMEVPNMEEGKETWDENPMGCKKLINQYWLKEKKGSTAKTTWELFRNNFYEDYHDLVTMLSRVMGLPSAAFFQEWMVYFVEQILCGNKDVTTKATFYWGGIISDYFHEQFMNVKKSSKFYNPYLVYSLAEKRQYNRLFGVPDEEHGRRLKAYDKYPQLQFRNFKEYFRVNDAFIGHIIRLLGGDFERKVSHSAGAFLKQYTFLFIQFPKFTYIHAQGFTERPNKLPWYPND